MKLNELHQNSKEVSTAKLNESEIQAAISIQIIKGGTLAKHITKTPAKLFCITGEIIYETEKGEKLTMISGDYVNIEANVLHWLYANEKSQLILFK